AAPLTRARAQALRFEVASIKPTKSEGGRGALEVLPGGGLKMGNVTVRNLIAFAYDVREEQVQGGPRWIGSETYDVLAKPDPPDGAIHRQAAPGTAAWNRVRQRTQALLAERCQLVIHKTSKEGPIFALVVAKNGPKLEPLKDADDIPPGTMRSRGQINARAGTMRMLATVLSNWLGRPVEDRTGLTGRYSYRLEYSEPDAGKEATDANPPEVLGASVLTALQEQLGLKLEPTRGAAETIVIDRVERPSAN